MPDLATGPVLHAFGGLELTALELTRRLELDERRFPEVERVVLRLVMAGRVDVTSTGLYRVVEARP